jgi:mono/diheme cytochrome c family protein
MTTPTPERGERVLTDADTDVEIIHRQIIRELRDPEEGFERVPWFVWTTVAVLVFWSGWYIGRRGGTFDTSTHVEYAQAARPGAAGAAPVAAADPIAEGRRIFGANCQACHQADGKGVKGAFPPVVGSEWVNGDERVLVRILLHGLQGPITVAGNSYNGMMPAWRESLSDADIAHVATYLRQWAPNAAPAVSEATVKAERDAHAARTTSWTAAELGGK